MSDDAVLWLVGVARKIVAVAVVAALLITTPGRAGLGWAAKLIGIGDSGGSPPIRDRGPLPSTASPLVVDAGRAPDGTRYEWLVDRDRRADDSTLEPSSWRIGGPEGLCLRLHWPDRPGRPGSLACSAGPERHAPAPSRQSLGAIQSLTQARLQRAVEDVAHPDTLLSGTTSGAVRRLTIAYADRAGAQHLQIDFARVQGKRLRRVGVPPGKPGPFGIFTAFVPGRLTNDAGASEELPAPVTLVDQRLRTGHGPTDDCVRQELGRPPAAGPYTLTAYDAEGRVVGIRRTLARRGLPGACLPGWATQLP